jgi:urate oxidase
MGIVLGENQYGKAESRVVRIYRELPRHEIRDVTVSTALRGGFADAHTAGDQSSVLPTDSQKQAVYSFAKEAGIDSIERYGLALARHFVDNTVPVRSARIEIDELAWERAVVGGAEHEHTWVRRGPDVRTAVITVAGKGSDQRAWVVGGVKELVLLKSAGSEFHGFLEDKYTVLEPTRDRIMSTSLVAKWRFADARQEWSAADWDAVYAGAKQLIIETFATHRSQALQQTLFEIGKAILNACPRIAEVRLSAPNKHHFRYDLAPFGVANNNEVFHADDRPYGLIQAAVLRDDAPDAGPAWASQQGWLG